MFDMKEAAAYRGVSLNDVAYDASDLAIEGNQLVSVDMSGVEGVGYSEKRAHGDGRDASDVFQNGRTFDIVGTTYGTNRANLFDRLQAVIAAFTPRLAYLGNPTLRGYVPFTFKVPTADAEFPSGFRDMFINVRPRLQPKVTIDRDRTGGHAGKPMAITWRVALDAIDPRFYVQGEVEEAINPDGATTALVMRGDYPTPLFLDLDVLANKGDQTMTLAINGGTMTIVLPDSATPYTISYDGKDKVARIGSTLRMDLLSFPTEIMHPTVPAGGDDAVYSFSLADTVAATSVFRYYEAFA